MAALVRRREPSCLDSRAGLAGPWPGANLANCARWRERLAAIAAEIAATPAGDTSNRTARDRAFRDEDGPLEPGSLLASILAYEEHGRRTKR